jgi:hypothetical protein
LKIFQQYLVYQYQQKAEGNKFYSVFIDPINEFLHLKKLEKNDLALAQRPFAVTVPV